jgi:hypothetical protein
VEHVIRIKDQQELIEISFSELRKYHGGAALMALAVGYRVMQVAINELFGSQPPQRKSLKIFSGHGGPGFRDAFEFITRAVTRGAYEVDVNYPNAQHDPFRAQSYAFIVTADHGAAVEVALKSDFLPHIFYEYMEKGRKQQITEQEIAQFAELRSVLCERALAAPHNELLVISTKVISEKQI